MTKAETKTLLQLLEEVPDHREGNAIKYSLRDILFLGMFAILCGAETYTGILDNRATVTFVRKIHCFSNIIFQKALENKEEIDFSGVHLYSGTNRVRGGT